MDRFTTGTTTILTVGVLFVFVYWVIRGIMFVISYLWGLGDGARIFLVIMLLVLVCSYPVGWLIDRYGEE